jgi:hypothetical protein
VAGLSSTWRAGEVRPTFSVEAKPRYLRSLEKISTSSPVASPAWTTMPTTSPITTPTNTKLQTTPPLVYAKGGASSQALHMAQPMVCRRLEGLPNINARQHFEELSVQ